MGRLLVGVLLAGLCQGGEGSLWQYVHPQARAIAGTDWKKVADSDVGRLLQSELARLGLKNTGPASVLDSMERLLISSPGASGLQKDPPALVALEGRFDSPRVRAVLAEGTTSKRYRGIEICSGPRGSGGQPMELAILSHTLLLIGDRSSVRAAIDHAVPPSGPLMARARRMAAENEIWAVMSTPPSAFAGEGLPQAALLKDIQGMDLGVALGRGMAISLHLKSSTPAKAKEMNAALATLLSLAEMESGDQQLKQLASRVRISADSNTVAVTFAMDAGELRESLRAVSGRLRQSAATAPTPRRMVIRIEGLDDGPREIPMNLTVR
ncbi:MAG: hypothetical protein ABI693_03030 [Bryobacteraceae bacterium]